MKMDNPHGALDTTETVEHDSAIASRNIVDAGLNDNRSHAERDCGKTLNKSEGQRSVGVQYLRDALLPGERPW